MMKTLIRNPLLILAASACLFIFAGPITSTASRIDVTLNASPESPVVPGTEVIFTAEVQGGTGDYEYRFIMKGPATNNKYVIVQDYSPSNIWSWTTDSEDLCCRFKKNKIKVFVRRAGSRKKWAAHASIRFVVSVPRASDVTLTPSVPSPATAGTTVDFTAQGQGGTGDYEYQFIMKGPATNGRYVIVQDYSPSNIWSWTTDSGDLCGDIGRNKIRVFVRSVGSCKKWDAHASIRYIVVSSPENHPPLAQDDTATTSENTPIASIAVLTNDSDPDGDTLSISSFTQPANGTVSDNGDGTFAYTPDQGFTGSDTFTYTVSDGNGGTDTATVVVAVVPADDPPLLSIVNPIDASVISNAQPLIFISYSDPGSGIDTASFNAQLDSQDVTGLFTISDTTAEYPLSTDLAPGTHNLSISISDNNGHTATGAFSFEVRASSEPMRYLFSVEGSSWVFASPGDGTCSVYRQAAEMGINAESDIIALSQIYPDGDLFFALLGQDNLLRSPSDGTNSIYRTGTEMGLSTGEQIAADHEALNVNSYFAIDNQPDLLQSDGSGTNSSFMSNTQLGLEPADQINCLHIGYDDAIYFCDQTGLGVMLSTGDGTNNDLLTASDLGVPAAQLNAFVIIPDTDPPLLTITQPADGSVITTGTPNVVIAFSDSGSGLDLGTFYAEINGVDSTASFNVTSSGADYQIQTPLPQGSNTISANISDNVGNQALDSADFTVNATVWNAAISAAPLSGGIPLAVQFAADITGGTPPYTIEWDLDGDGTIDDNRQNFNYLYQTQGVYSVALTVNDSAGLSATDSVTITALVAPMVIATANPNGGSAPLDVAFSATVSDPDSTIALYEWDFNGDGTYDASSDTTPDAAYTYTAAGMYSATLRVTDSDNLQTTSIATVNVGSKPTATASAEPMSGTAPLDVTFTGTGSDSDGSIAVYEWDFDGDGAYDWSSPTSGNTSYTYPSSGRFNATLRVMDDHGLTATDSVLISVAGPPVALPRAFPLSGTVPLTVTFFADGEDVDGSPKYYYWDFDGDGTYDQTLVASMNTTFTYSQPGNYAATLMVTDNEGLSGTASVDITVNAIPSGTSDLITAMAYPTNGSTPLAVGLDLRLTNPQNQLTSISWDFDNDGTVDFQEAIDTGADNSKALMLQNNVISTSSSSGAKFADIDNDGDPDLFILSDGAIHQFRNDGTPEAAQWTDAGILIDPTGGKSGTGFAFVDIDADGDLDLFVGEYSNVGSLFFYRNDGDAAAPLWTDLGYVADGSGSLLNTGGFCTPAFGDMDNDNDLDLIAGTDRGTYYYVRNDGDASEPVWTAVGRLQYPNGNDIDVGTYSTLALFDLDQDGDLDIISGSSSSNIGLYQNSGDAGSPSWSDSVYLLDAETGRSLSTVGYTHPTFTDIDNDGQIDLFIGSSQTSFTFYHCRQPDPNDYLAWQVITDYYPSFRVWYYPSPAFGDMDGDGDKDLLIGDNTGKIVFVRNDGDATAPVWVLADKLRNNADGNLIDIGSYSSLALADIDGDGDLDLFSGELEGRIALLRNVGDASSPAWSNEGFITDGTGTTIDTAAGYTTPTAFDIDGDGDLDLIVGGSNGLLSLIQNDGDASTPTWYEIGVINDASGQYIDLGDYSAPFILDMDRDGDGDMLVGDYDGRIYHFDNIGGSHNPQWQLSSAYTDITNGVYDAGERSSPALVDIDNDGDPDLFAGNSDGGIFYYPKIGSATNTYTSPGIYQAVVSATDEIDLTINDSVRIEVYATGFPTAAASAAPTTGTVPMDVTFLGNGWDPNGTIVLYEWDFDGDGTYDYNSTTTGNTTHTYNAEGYFDAAFRVTDNDGNTAGTTVTVNARLNIAASNTDVFNPVDGEGAAIASTQTGCSDITITIVDQQGAVVRTLVDQEQRCSGDYTDVWDGRDDSGNIVGDGIYHYIIEYDGSGGDGVYDPRETAAYTEIAPSKSWPTNYNPFAGDRVNITYTLAHPAEVSLFFWKRSGPGTGSQTMEPVRTLLLREPRGAGTHTEVWDGVDDSGILLGLPTRYDEVPSFPITLWAYELPQNAIIVTGNKPEIQSIGGEPVYFYPGYNAYATNPANHFTVTFELSKSADVDYKVINASGRTVNALNQAMMPPGTNTLIWDGRNFEGRLVDPGIYTVELIATDQTGSRSLPRYAVAYVLY